MKFNNLSCYILGQCNLFDLLTREFSNFKFKRN